MNFHYPNGKVYHKTKIKSASTSQLTFANRGMRFEDAINESNEYYRNKRIAVIHKKPTPIQIVKVDYPKRSAATIKEAYFKEASTTDYNGVYRGYYLDFEAKATQNRTSFPLKNFHIHQIEHMRSCMEQSGICFVLLYFSSLHRCFFLDAKTLIAKWDLQKTERKSIPIDEIIEVGIEIKMKIAPRVDYLEAVNQYLSNKGEQ